MHSCNRVHALNVLLKEAKAAPEKQDRNDLPGKDEHHDYYFKETGRRSKD